MSEKPNIVLCSNCKSKILEDDNYCWSCGYPLGKKKETCYYCKKTISSDWKACAWCGATKGGILIKSCFKCKRTFRTTNPKRELCDSCYNKTKISTVVPKEIVDLAYKSPLLDYQNKKGSNDE